MLRKTLQHAYRSLHHLCLCKYFNKCSHCICLITKWKLCFFKEKPVTIYGFFFFFVTVCDQNKNVCPFSPFKCGKRVFFPFTSLSISKWCTILFFQSEALLCYTLFDFKLNGLRIIFRWKFALKRLFTTSLRVMNHISVCNVRKNEFLQIDVMRKIWITECSPY